MMRFGLVPFALAVLIAGNCNGQIVEAERFHSVVQSLGGWQEREAAFYHSLRSVPTGHNEFHRWGSLLVILAANSKTDADLLRMDLIQALSKDVAWSKRQTPLSEEFTNYQGDLIAAVSSLKDVGSSRVLFKLIDSGNMAIGALAEFGDGALAEAVRGLRSRPESSHRHSLVRLLAMIAEPGKVTNLKNPGARNLLRESLVASLRDENISIRSEAIRGLATLGDVRAVGALNAVEKNDAMSGIRLQAAAAVAKLSGGGH